MDEHDQRSAERRRRARHRRAREHRRSQASRTSPNLRMDPETVLVALAVLGVVLTLGTSVFDLMDLGPRQDRGVLLGLFVAGCAVAAVRFVTPAAWTALRARPRLLVPLGLITGVQIVLGWCAAWSLLSTLLLSSTEIWFLQLSILFVAQVLAQALYGSWTTVMIVDAARGREGSPVATFRTALGWFPRVLGLEFICWSFLMVSTVLVLPLAASAMPLALAIITLIGLGTNFATAALLPVAVTETGGFFAALGAGVGASRAGWRRWWKPLVMQLLLLGFITFIAVSYSHVGGHSSKTNWGVNAFWIGGYENESRWYGKYIEARETPAVDWIVAVLALAFGVLAIAVKLHIAQALESPDAPEPRRRRSVPPRPTSGSPHSTASPTRRPPPGIALRRARRRLRRSRGDTLGSTATPPAAPDRATDALDTPTAPDSPPDSGVAAGSVAVEARSIGTRSGSPSRRENHGESRHRSTAIAPIGSGARTRR